ncbi:ATP-dependent nuclease [Pedobacter gandavensis]|uniref:ATP-dependent nuclease n=1 Tax=Pedobacter gandavensis TaxID=2679963 RepID=UPI00292D8A00|nr:AAA family ATPase [Pedobacter gandavensis]
MKVLELVTKSGQQVRPNKLTVLVGANNSGKSQTLRDIRGRLVKGNLYQPVVFQDIIFEFPPTFEEFTKNCVIEPSTENLSHRMISGLNPDLLSEHYTNFDPVHIQRLYNDPSNHNTNFTGTFTQFNVAYLDSETRLKLGATTGAYNPHHERIKNVFQGIVHDKATEKELQKIFKLAFGMEIVFDASGYTTWCFRVAKKMPAIPGDTRDAGAVTSSIPKLDDQGDGFKSFVGIVMALLRTKDRVILLDEPEAFLHPTQARYLGKWIADNLDLFSSQIIISTHNASFLSGLLAGGKPVDVYRLNRVDDDTSFNLIPAAVTAQLAKHPLLSSQRVMETLFYRGVVVCEADADRSVYQGVATINLQNQDILFVHAHNKQTLNDVASLLMRAKVPVVTIADIDLLNTAADLKKLVETLSGQPIDAQLTQWRDKVAASVNSVTDDVLLAKLHKEIKEFEEQLINSEHTLAGAKGALSRIKDSFSTWGDIKRQGVMGFDTSVRSDAEEIIKKCKSFGLFIVPVGELEGWITTLGVSKKNKWIVPALEEIHKGNAPSTLVDFVAEICDYLEAKKII